MSTSAPPLSLILGGCPILFLQLSWFFVLLYKSISPPWSLPPSSSPHSPTLFFPQVLLPPVSPISPSPCLTFPQSRLPVLSVHSKYAPPHDCRLSTPAFVSCRLMRFFVTSVFLTRFKKKKNKEKDDFPAAGFFLHVSLSEVCAFYSKENIFYILLTVDFFVVNIFCIFIYKSHKKNSDVQLYTLNLQLEENKVNSVVSGSKCPFKKCAFFFFLSWVGTQLGFLAGDEEEVMC